MPSEKEIEAAAKIIEAKSYQWYKGDIHHETELEGSEAWFEYVAKAALEAAEAVRDDSSASTWEEFKRTNAQRLDRLSKELDRQFTPPNQQETKCPPNNSVNALT